jgi:hypothetical protein
MSADTNNVSGIRGVPRRRETLIAVKFSFALSGYPIFPPSTSLPPSVPPSPPTMPRYHRHCRQPHLQPRCRAVANPIPDPAFSFDIAGGVPVVVPDPIAVPDPVAPSLRRSVLSSLTPSHHHRACEAAPLHQRRQPLFQGWSRAIKPQCHRSVIESSA